MLHFKEVMTRHLVSTYRFGLYVLKFAQSGESQCVGIFTNS